MVKILTGGQTGVDTGALLAAVEAKISASAIFPAGLRREPVLGGALDGKGLSDLLTSNGGKSTCLQSNDYAQRTREVIRKAQGCLIISPDVTSSPGTALTLKLARDEGVQLWVFQKPADRAYWKAEGHAIGYWLKQLETVYQDLTLMVAGPRAGKWPAGESVTRDILRYVFEEVKSK